MHAFTIANLRDLVGGWSCLAFAAGLMGAILCFLSSRTHVFRPASGAPANVGRTAAWAMVLIAICIEFYVLPGSVAYSGPVPPEFRLIWLYDKHFAALIALAFGIVFAFDAFWIRKLYLHTPRRTASDQ